MARPHRPAGLRPVQAILPADLIQQLDAECDRRNVGRGRRIAVTRSSLMEQAIRAFLQSLQQ